MLYKNLSQDGLGPIVMKLTQKFAKNRRITGWWIGDGVYNLKCSSIYSIMNSLSDAAAIKKPILTDKETHAEKPLSPSSFWDFGWEISWSSLTLQSSQGSWEDISEHQWSGTHKKCEDMNFLNRLLYSFGEMTVGKTFFGTSEDFTQVSSCLSQVYCLR